MFETLQILNLGTTRSSEQYGNELAAQTHCSLQKQQGACLSKQTFTQVFHRPLPSQGNQQRMLKLEAFSHLGHPQSTRKTNNGLGYITQTTQAFLEKWGIQHKTGIPYNPTGQAIVKKPHQIFKT